MHKRVHANLVAEVLAYLVHFPGLVGNGIDRFKRCAVVLRVHIDGGEQAVSVVGMLGVGVLGEEVVEGLYAFAQCGVVAVGAEGVVVHRFFAHCGVEAEVHGCGVCQFGFLVVVSLHVGVSEVEAGALRNGVVLLLHFLQAADSVGVFVQFVLRYAEQIDVFALRGYLLVLERLLVQLQVLGGIGVVAFGVCHFAEDAVHFGVAAVVGVVGKQFFGTCVHLVEVALCVVYLDDVVRHYVLVLLRVLNLKKRRQRLVVVAKPVVAVGVVVLALHRIGVLAVFQCFEACCSGSHIVHFDEGVAPIEIEHGLVLACQFFPLDLVEGFQCLFVTLTLGE